MNVAEKIFALKSAACFAGLSDGDLAGIADSVQERVYEPGELFCAGGKALGRMYIVTDGAIQTRNGERMPPVMGPVSLMFELPVKDELVASPAGARCMIIEKGVFFTIIYRHPCVLLNILEQDRFEVQAPEEGL